MNSKRDKGLAVAWIAVGMVFAIIAALGFYPWDSRAAEPSDSCFAASEEPAVEIPEECLDDSAVTPGY
jgi:hypothetical protein